MRITKLPIPLLIAAVAVTSVAVIYVYLTAPPMPIYTDHNFTQPLLSGTVYVWRGAAHEYIFSSDEIILLTHEPAHHLIYLTGPMGNITVSNRIWVVYLFGGRPLYVMRIQPVGWSAYACHIFRLEDVTPTDSTFANLTMWLPRTFAPHDYITTDEYNALIRIVGTGLCYSFYRVVSVQSNGTHLIYRVTPITTYFEETHLTRMSSVIQGRTIRVTNNPFSVSYSVGEAMFTARFLPYMYFAIVPTDTTMITIYVN